MPVLLLDANWLCLRKAGIEVEEVVERYRQGDDQTLADLDPVDAGEDVDGVGAKGGLGMWQCTP